MGRPGLALQVSAVNLWGPCFIEYTKQVMYDNWRPGQGYFHGVKEGYSGISPFSPRVPLDVQVPCLLCADLQCKWFVLLFREHVPTHCSQSTRECRCRPVPL